MLMVPSHMLLNGVINGGDIHIQWKEGIVVLMYKRADVSVLKNDRPIVIINVILKVWMIIVKRSGEKMGREEWYVW